MGGEIGQCVQPHVVEGYSSESELVSVPMAPRLVQVNIHINFRKVASNIFRILDLACFVFIKNFMHIKNEICVLPQDMSTLIRSLMTDYY